MGISIDVDGFPTQHPYPVAATFECDDTSQMFCRGFMTILHSEGYAGAHTEAMRAGWLERNTSHGRLWLCPECSGK